MTTTMLANDQNMNIEKINILLNCGYIEQYSVFIILVKLPTNIFAKSISETELYTDIKTK